MAIYIPVQTYPKNVLRLSEEERASFDVDNRDQVAEFVAEAIERITRTAAAPPNPMKLGAIIEFMLDDGALEDDMRKEDFKVDPNCVGHRFRDFVMEYVEKNYESTTKKLDAYSTALKKLGMAAG